MSVAQVLCCSSSSGKNKFPTDIFVFVIYQRKSSTLDIMRFLSHLLIVLETEDSADLMYLSDVSDP